MFRYVKEAFWARPALAGLGRIPWNALAVAGTALLGFGEPAIWLAGAGLEAIYLYTLTSNGRFRKWVDATHLPAATVDTDTPLRQRNLLDSASRSRLEALEEKRLRIGTLYRDSSEDDFLFDSNRDALEQLSGIFLKLLVARKNLVEHGSSTSEQELTARIAAVERELAGGKASESLRESREATLVILRQRLRNLHRREETLAEMESDLTRIEAQFDLAVEDATLKGRPAAISANIDLVSHLLDDALLDPDPAAATTYASRDLEN